MSRSHAGGDRFPRCGRHVAVAAVVMLLVLVACACAPRESEIVRIIDHDEFDYESWIGLTREDVEEAWGPPTWVESDEQGRPVLHYAVVLGVYDELRLEAARRR